MHLTTNQGLDVYSRQQLFVTIIFKTMHYCTSSCIYQLYEGHTSLAHCLGKNKIQDSPASVDPVDRHHTNTHHERYVPVSSQLSLRLLSTDAHEAMHAGAALQPIMSSCVLDLTPKQSSAVA